MLLRILTIYLLLLASVCRVPAAEQPAEPGSVLLEVAGEPDSASYIARFNHARSQARNCGTRSFKPAAPLVWNGALQQAALVHSRDMAAHKNLNHKGSDGSKVFFRVLRFNYQFETVGENIARSPYDLAATLKVWLGSPGHCANIMNPDFTEMGGAVYETYWTTVFGKPAPRVLVEYPDEQLSGKTVQPKPRKEQKK